VIGLDPPAWNRLRHAYGPATDIPSLLRQLKRSLPIHDYKDEPWFSLWSALCHQGDVFGASYAAVPHIVQIGLDVKRQLDSDFFLLPACIEVARATNHGPEPEPDMAQSYFDSLQKLHLLAFAHSTDDWNSDMAQSVAAALAASKGQIELAQALINLDNDIIRKINAADW
jgi:hypothetical protein